MRRYTLKRGMAATGKAKEQNQVAKLATLTDESDDEPADCFVDETAKATGQSEEKC